MIDELNGAFKGKITRGRILFGEYTKMSVNGLGKIIGIEATYASTGVFSSVGTTIS